MNTATIPSHFSQPRSKLVNAVAISVALATVGYVGYGIVDVAAHFVQAPSQAPAMVRGSMTSSVPQAPATDVLPAASAPSRIVTAGDQVETPRECALDKGITEACSFN